MRRILTLALAVAALVPLAAQASDWTTIAKVTQIQASQVPFALLFSIDTSVGPANGNCAANNNLIWNAHGPDTATQYQNAQAAYAMLLTAKSTGQSVILFGNNNCSVDLMTLVP